jgi:hypothetical protein
MSSPRSPAIRPNEAPGNRWASGLLLVAFGALILRKGMLFAGM